MNGDPYLEMIHEHWEDIWRWYNRITLLYASLVMGSRNPSPSPKRPASLLSNGRQPIKLTAIYSSFWNIPGSPDLLVAILFGS